MTRHSKCELCRARKIKCDEARPSCGPCEKKGRVCQYKNDNDSIFVHEQIGALQQHSQSQSSTTSISRSTSYRSERTDQDSERSSTANPVTLRLKRSHKAESGTGEFLMFGRPRRQYNKVKIEPPSGNETQLESNRPPSALPPSPLTISSPQETLAARWISIAGPASLNLYPLGTWIKCAWANTGCNDYLDLAVDYTMSAMTAFRNEKGNDFIKISTIGGRAVRRLRQAIMSGTRSIDLYVAIMLHYAAEHFRGMRTCYWISHMSAVSQLLASRTTNNQEQDTVQSIIHATGEDEVMEAILNGQLSMWEGLTSPATVLGSLELDIALSELERLLVKLPRLVLLVREAKQNPHSADAMIEAIALGQELYGSTGTLTIERTLANLKKRTKSIPTRISSSPEPTSFDFNSLADFILSTRYFVYRLLVSALVQTICDLQQDGIPFEREKAETEDIWAARCILKSVEWAFKTEQGVHLTMLRMLIPIQIGFGAWHRLEKRQTLLDAPEYLHASRMKAVSIEIANQIDTRFGNIVTTPWRLEGITEMFAGGELREWMYNYRSVSGSPVS